jgi:hypothetical protein
MLAKDATTRTGSRWVWMIRRGNALQRVQVLEMMRRLSEPASAALPQEQLDRAAEVAIRRTLIGGAEPGRVAGHAQGGVRRGAHEAEVEQQHVLFGRVGLDGMDREELRREIAQPALGDLGRRMRGSRPPRAAAPGDGAGLSASHESSGRSAGSQVSSRWSMVVPVRWSPSTKTGSRTGSSRISG